METSLLGGARQGSKIHYLWVLVICVVGFLVVGSLSLACIRTGCFAFPAVAGSFRSEPPVPSVYQIDKASNLYLGLIGLS